MQFTNLPKRFPTRGMKQENKISLQWLMWGSVGLFLVAIIAL